MPVTCIVAGCKSMSRKDNVSFFSIPAPVNFKHKIHLNNLSRERREMWIKVFKRPDLNDTKLKYQRVCSKHFIEGKPAPLAERNHPDWIPTQNMGYKSVLIKKNIPETGVHVQTDLSLKDIKNQENELQYLNEKKYDLSKQLIKTGLNEESFKNNNDKILFYTGLNYPLFKIVLETIEPFLPKHALNALNPFKQLLLTLMKLRLNLSFKDLGYRFAISVTSASVYFEKTIEILYIKLKSLIIWPDHEIRNKNIPHCFKEVFHEKTTVIIDCFEIFIQKPSNYLTRQQCWSNYKHHHTVKFLIGITPQGTICYISNAWGGRISDKQIVQNSTFLNFISPHDIVLADRGFLIKDMIGILQAKLVIPAFTKGKSQLHPLEVEETRHMAHVRIHVERIIGVIRNKFQIFQSIVPATMLSNIIDNKSILDKIITVCCAIVNLSPPIIPL